MLENTKNLTSNKVSDGATLVELLSKQTEVHPAKPVKKTGKKWRMVRRIAVGLGTFVLINVLVLMLEPYFLKVVSYELNHTAEKILLYQQQPAPDIVFLGSSRVENGLDPAIVEQSIAQQTRVRPRVLNLAMPRGSLQLSYLLLKNIIEENRKPSVIVYGLAEMEVGNPVQSSNYYENITGEVPNSEVLFRPDDLGRYGGNQLEQQAIFMLKQLVPLVRDQQLILKALNIQFNNENINHAAFLNQATITQNGYVPIYTSLEDPANEANGEIYQRELSKFQVQSYELEFFKALLDLAKARSIKVVLVNMPVSDVHQAFWQDDSKIKLYRDTIQNFARENAVPLLDVYRDADRFPPESFYDTNHLNAQGTTVLSQMLAKDYLASYFSSPEKPTGDFFKGKFTDLAVPARLSSKLTTSGTVNIQNLSSYFWPTFGTKSVRLSYHWLKADGSFYIKEGEQTRLTYSLRPGETRTVRFNLKTPDQPGQYILQMDLNYESVGWFSEAGGPTIRKPVTIEK